MYILLRMKGGQSAGGYTILEVMIFLVVTSFIFVSAMVAVNGQQERTQFGQGVRELDQRILGVINDVANGFFPQTNLRCTANTSTAATSPGAFTLSAGGQQGQNEQCTFIGKSLHLSAQSATPNAIHVYSLLGRREINVTASRNRQVTNLTESLVRVANGGVDLTERDSTKFGLQVVRVVTVNGGQEVASFAFVPSFGRYNVQQTNLLSESQPVRLALTSIGTGSVGQSEATVTGLINAMNETAVTNAINSGGIVICLRSTAGNQRAAIIIGEQGKQLTTRIDQDVTPGEFATCGAGF